MVLMGFACRYTKQLMLLPDSRFKVLMGFACCYPKELLSLTLLSAS